MNASEYYTTCRKMPLKRIVRQNKAIHKEGGYVGINCRLSNTKPLSSNQHENFGGFGWYQLIKNHCCNFDAKQREGYCITLSEPYQTFNVKCSDCSYLGQLLAIKYMS
jgi:hypothetical protein